MNPRLFFVLVLWIITLLKNQVTSLPSDLSLQDSELQQSSSLFGSVIEFEKKFSDVLYNDKKDENVIWSPLSLFLGLSMVAFGADGNTLDQLRNAICLPKTNCLIQENFDQLLNNLTNANETSLATKISIVKNFEVQTSYMDLMKNNFHSEIDYFEQPFSPFINKTNQWFAEKTKGLIDNILEKDDIDQDTRMLLLNALYFKAEWYHVFDPKIKPHLTFYDIDGKVTPMQMMYQENKFRFGDIKTLNAKIVEIPYKNSNYTLTLIKLRNYRNHHFNRTEFEELGKNLKTFDFESSKEFYIQKIELKMPKFTIKQNIDFSPHLKNMGVTDMYDNQQANFNKMVKNNNVVITKLKQSIYLSADETGTTAAAATMVISTDRNSVPRFEVDQPFYFKLSSLEGVLFSGKIVRLDSSFSLNS